MSPPSSRWTAVVRSRTGEAVEVSASALPTDRGGRRQTAEVAAGCLLAPEEGDFVACLTVGDRVYVTHVLERPTVRPVPIPHHRPGSLTIQADGELRVAARSQLTGTGRVVELHGGAVALRAERGQASVHDCVAAGDTVEGRWMHCQEQGATVDADAERIVDRAHAAEHHVLHEDQRRCQDLDVAARGEAWVRGRATVVRADHTVTAHGGPIQFG